MLPNNELHMESILRAVPLFADLSPELLDELLREARSATFLRDQAIYRVGDMPRELYILLSGQVKLALSCNRGNERIVDLVDAGRSFGEAELFGPHPYLVSALAIKPATLLCIAGTSLQRVMMQDSRIALPLIKLLAQRQFELETELAANHSRSGSRRLLDFFLGLAGPHRGAARETLVTLGISKRLLASRFDMQPETLSRTLRELVAAGLIAVDGRQIKLRTAEIECYLAQADAAPPIVAARRGRSLRKSAGACGGGVSVADVDRREPDFQLRCDPINVAGRQRMLSQRMAKSWLMLERGVLARRSRLVLRQSVDLFDSQLQALDLLAGSADSHAACAELGKVWLPYRALLDSAPSRRGARQLFAMNEQVLAAAQELTASFERDDGTRRGRLVNLAGRERMLSQRVAKFFMFQHMGIQVPKCRDELQRANEEFSTALVELAEATRDTPQIAAELQRVAVNWSELRSALVAGDDADFASIARKVFNTSEHLLQRMDSAVKLCVGLPG
ncbi:MAG: hypothetical protein A3H93_05760 [Rhodocyclales bacterium RIFCSPLOWO2_02_FULL_63_24]|nr:MAG: hypothetical protein A3H93_05760 [Rhodocyclales bacterium RIFCSPLOWO2_02_FULL_63_24]